MSELYIIEQPISRNELKGIALERYGDLVKGAVDIEKGIMVLGGELHIDEALKLVEQFQSKGKDIWGINLYPEKTGDDMIEFDSMINLKPDLGNRTRGVDSLEIQDKIKNIVHKLIV
ncbi:MAG: hypothetical protein A2735_02625 [Candidatus Yanofskybacteria bacterium RIFCSPHIGHO2_01_FULL_41_21]|uniref:Uncharacterized protein n=1 Tax=Candidatus Yanofskybacteria bacterium RIFCSPHIGHO2_01_FULL_41_21 TaxID=1802660 RepID=A0A1F8E8R8_9BACT|nr:MAG: hypothetical protein A2735_02625 [Candidatus Yanofskybacteria bacterium RIFCSPHIGHO2_01_FULL_41_21]